LVAEPKTASYGRLSVLAEWRCTTKLLFDIAPSAFVPPPKVTSSLVRLTPRPDPPEVRLADLERVTAAAFGQRRKMLRQSLKTLLPEPGPLLAAVGIDPTARAEDISIDGFVALTRAFAAGTAG
jgi:16S rRNA (adenine1518-N6/adenine1519-N6)-dimethyltransferase